MLEDPANAAAKRALEFGRHLLASRNEHEAALMTTNARELWRDGASAWTRLRRVEHWLERGRRR
jgi:hypothetical protein